MRRGSYALVPALLGMLALSCSPSSAQPYSQEAPGQQVDVGIFYDGLAPYGEWVEMPEYGWSWAPRVERDWRPYTRGQWLMTDDGWFWDSDEPFGWAAYHYGRWVNDQDYGWVWVPGTDWAPAWVSWRHGNGYTGWAPLPPRATWRTRIGLDIGGLEIDAFIGARDYSFVQDRSFVDRGIYQRILPPTQNLTIINVTNNVTNYTVVNRRVVNGGVAVANVERALGRAVPRARTVDQTRADAPRRARANEVAVFRPEVRAAPERRPARGSSLVRGEAPPPVLVERRRQREQDRQQTTSGPAVTAKDVEQRRPAENPRARARDAAEQQPAVRTDARTQQRLERERNQANDPRQREQAAPAPPPPPTRQPPTPRTDARAEQQEAQSQRDRARQDAAEQRTRGQDQAREKRQADEQRQRDQRVDQQRAKRDGEAQAGPGKPAKGVPPPVKDDAKGKGKGKDKGKSNEKE